jgi:membrane-associated phospholipid phosphatase
VKLAAKVISIIFHPLLLTTYLVLLLGIFFPAILGIKMSELLLFAAFIFVLTFVFPALNILFILKFSSAPANAEPLSSSISMMARENRITPFIWVSMIYVSVTALFIYKSILGTNFNKIMMIVTLLVVVGTVITFFYKISVHSLAMGGLIGIILPMNKIADGALLWPTVIGIAVAGLVMSSRLMLNAHTPREVLSGVLTGFIAAFGGIFFLF